MLITSRILTLELTLYPYFNLQVLRELIAQGGIKVMLRPEVAARLKHYFGVDGDKIELYDVKILPGF